MAWITPATKSVPVCRTPALKPTAARAIPITIRDHQHHDASMMRAMKRPDVRVDEAGNPGQGRRRGRGLPPPSSRELAAEAPTRAVGLQVWTSALRPWLPTPSLVLAP